MIKVEHNSQTDLEIERKNYGQVKSITWDSRLQELKIERVYGYVKNNPRTFYPSKYNGYPVYVTRTYKLDRHASLFFMAINSVVNNTFDVNLLQHGFEVYS